MRSLPVVFLAACLAACTTGGRGDRRPRVADDPPPLAARQGDPLPDPTPKDIPGRIPGTPSIRIVWEALQVEQQRSRESRFHPNDMNPLGGEPEQEVILLNASFVPTPEQDHENRSQRAVGRIARVPDQDMLDLLREIEKTDFFRYAQPTEAVRPYFASDRARGRITVERGGESLTLVSQRGLGLQAATREIPGIYAQVKYAIQLLKNRTPAMSVRNASVDPADPGAMRRSGARTGAGK